MAINKTFCFSSNFDETWWSCSAHGYYNFTKFHQNRNKNKTVLLIAHFLYSYVHLFLNSLIFAYSLLNDPAQNQIWINLCYELYVHRIVIIDLFVKMYVCTYYIFDNCSYWWYMHYYAACYHYVKFCSTKNYVWRRSAVIGLVACKNGIKMNENGARRRQPKVTKNS